MRNLRLKVKTYKSYYQDLLSKKFNFNIKFFYFEKDKVNRKYNYKKFNYFIKENCKKTPLMKYKKSKFKRILIKKKT